MKYVRRVFHKLHISEQQLQKLEPWAYYVSKTSSKQQAFLEAV